MPLPSEKTLSPTSPRPRLVAVVCHDAGGAEIISSYVRRQSLSCTFCLEGPAKGIFHRKLGVVPQVRLEKAVRASDWLLCGTSFPADLELRAIALAKSIGKPSAAFLDHWVNYLLRFERGGILTLPDELWVGDEIAEKLAKEALPGVPTRLVDNPYFEDIRSELRTVQYQPLSTQGSNVLYASERPGIQDCYSQRTALLYFLRNICSGSDKIGLITVRPHPSEREDQFAWLVDHNGSMGRWRPRIVVSNQPSLVEQVASHDWIVGRHSMALVVGILAGKRVMSFIPPGGKPCVLPFDQIERC